ncbi:isochorismatase family protein [Pedobacter frigidisoli]|uniref:Isochorismatase family protein n=1 Tax=Pedobacter frigidisoli TaxID=2530455 RepID=A0A4R0P8A7_9SPHI|nr:isochorismatase family protein [Pedobacter frigidisoli]TCD10835.1 isochorismatase family protein [Pedobacter frigidisoli]
MITALDKNTALVLIDLQNGIVNLPVVHPVKNILDNAAKLVAAFRKAQLPIVVVNVNPTPNKLRKDAKIGAFEPTAEWLKIVPQIKTMADDTYITKRTWNAFTNADLEVELKSRNITGIVLAGISTSIGVEGTARSANELGYNITFAEDAMSYLFADAHEHSLKRIFPRIGEVGATEEIIEKLGSLY